MLVVVAVAARSIAAVATAQPVIATHSTSAMITTHSVAHQAMAVTREVTLAADSRLEVATVVVRADDSLV